MKDFTALTVNDNSYIMVMFAYGLFIYEKNPEIIQVRRGKTLSQYPLVPPSGSTCRDGQKLRYFVSRHKPA
jgi:hypothetical protein